MANDRYSHYHEITKRDAIVGEGKPSTVIKYIERTFGPKDYRSDKRQIEYAKFFNKNL